MKTLTSSLAVLTCAATLALLTPQASASGRRFAYTYPVLTGHAGEVELENWVTYKNRPGALRTFEFRHELEIGLTDRTQIGLYVANWEHDARSGDNLFDSSAVEIIHNLTHPVNDWIGSALYGEFSMGEKHATFETKLLLEKRLGKWTVGWNGTFESEWEGEKFADFQESSGVLAQSLGVGYDLTDALCLGFETVHKTKLEKWSAPAKPQLHVGPSLTFRKKDFSATIGTLFQVSDRRDQASFQTRAIIGIEF